MSKSLGVAASNFEYEDGKFIISLTALRRSIAQAMWVFGHKETGHDDLSLERVREFGEHGVFSIVNDSLVMELET